MDINTIIEKCISGDKGSWDMFIKEFSYIVKSTVIYKLKLLNLSTFRVYWYEKILFRSSSPNSAKNGIPLSISIMISGVYIFW